MIYKGLRSRILNDHKVIYIFLVGADVLLFVLAFLLGNRSGGRSLRAEITNFEIQNGRGHRCPAETWDSPNNSKAEYLVTQLFLVVITILSYLSIKHEAVA